MRPPVVPWPTRLFLSWSGDLILDGDPYGAILWDVS
jgi:hypothetical protein